VIEEAVRRARQVIEAAESNRSRLVLISSFTTLPRNDSPLRGVETAWRRAAYPYFEAKAAMEQAVVEAAERGLEAVIVNPAACLGPWEFRADGSSLVRLILQRQLPVVMDQALSVIDVRDVAEAIDRALARGFFGRPIALAGHNVGLADLVGEIRAMSGITGSDPLPIDPILAATAAFWTSTAFAAFNQNASNIWRAVPLIADSFPMQPSPEQLAMDLNPRPLSVTLGDAIAFHRSWRPQ
jgi:nucleoside-diphosphate-sugar epimerase